MMMASAVVVVVVLLVMLMLSSIVVVALQPQQIQLQRHQLLQILQHHRQRSSSSSSLTRLWSDSTDSPGAPYDVEEVEEEEDDDDDISSTAAVGVDLDPMAIQLKADILDLAQRTKRGFQATNNDRQRAKDLILQLAKYNPTSDPASPYYQDDKQQYPSSSFSTTTSTTKSTLAGKWTLVYTDAPDITGLDTSRNPFATAVLGRIGQECTPPYIKNVIEWKRPTWTTNLPFSGRISNEDEPRILQKVVTSASANPKNPFKVDLKVAGFELMVGNEELLQGSSKSEFDDSFASRIESLGLVPGLLSLYPIDLKGPINYLQPPFGQFEILYLDNEFRIIRTYQGYYAINRRITSAEEEWF